MRLVDRLPDEEPFLDDEVDDLYRTEGPSGPAMYVPLIEAAEEEELMVVRSVLADRCIPFVVKCRETPPCGMAGPGRMFSNDHAARGPFRIDVPEKDLGYAREVLLVNVYQPISELRVKALEVKLLSGIIWAVIWSVLGFMIAYLIVPEDWDQALRLFIYILAGFTALTLGNSIQRSRRKAKDHESNPWLKGC